MTRDTLWTRTPASTPAVDGPEAATGDHDVVVIGGGLTGLTTALLLARAGQGVLLLEAAELGGATTVRSTAKVSLLQGTRLSTLATRHDAETLAAYVEAGCEGQAWLRRFCDDHAVPVETRTAYTFGITDSAGEAAAREHHVATDLGLPTRLEPDPGLPFRTSGAVALDDQFQLDPSVLVAALAEQARQAGACLVEGARVTGVSGTGPFRVTTAAGVATAEAVVLATNYPLVDLAGQFAWFTPQRSYALALSGAGPTGMHLSADSPSRSLREATVDGETHLLVGGQGHATGRVASTQDHLDELRHWASLHFPGREEVAAWSAQDYATADGLPWLGPVVPGVGRLLAAGGYDKWGFTTGVACALALVSRLLGGRIDWSEPLMSWRSRTPGLPDAGRHGLETGWQMAQGWGRALATSAPAETTSRVERRGVRPTAVSRVDGIERSVSAVCTHLGGIVRWNDAERSWDCPLHGSRFDPDGSVLEGPARCGLKRRGS